MASAIVSRLFPEHYPVHLLHHTKISEIAIPHQVIVCLVTGMQVSAALEILSRSNIISAPVINDSKFIGFLDMLDIVALLEQCKRTNVSMEDFFKMPIEKAMEMPMSKDIPILEGVPRHPMLDLPHDTSMAELLERMSRGSVHRVAMTKDGKVLAVITQRDILRWIVKNLKAFEHEKLIYNVNKKLSELGFGNPSDAKVATITEGKFAFEAFAEMRNRNISSFAVVDDTGKLKHVLSASDLRSLSTSNMDLLDLPIHFFLTKRPPMTLVTATGDDKLGDVLQKLDASGKHRVVVVDQLKPIAMVTLSDIIPLFAVMAQK